MSSTSKTGDSNDTALSSRERQRGTTYSTTQPLTGCNILFQSILYGSLRWFFTLSSPTRSRPDRTKRQSPPLWAANPELHSKEDGTAQQSNRYMTETASYLTQTEGGGSISMHLRPHIKAYQKPNGCDQVPRPTPSTTWERRS